MKDLQRIAAHYFDNLDNLTYTPDAFSRFKHGSRRYAQSFGQELAAALVATPAFERLAQEGQRRKIIVMPPPYINVPTAGYYLASAFFTALNQALAARGGPHAWWAKIYRRKSYFTDYGAMSEQERNATLGDEIFHVDGELLRHNLCLFIDDIRITGAHEQRIVKMLQHHGWDAYHDCYFLFYAQLACGETSPIIENLLNYHYVKDLTAVSEIIREDGFCLNTRVLKFIFAQPTTEFARFLEAHYAVLSEPLYSNFINNGYQLIPQFRNNFAYLQKLLGKDRER